MMTSTKFNVGLGDGRCSSRVLKPPGGGSSNIIFDKNEEQPQQQKGDQDSDLKSSFNFESEIKPKPRDQQPKQHARAQDSDIKSCFNFDSENKPTPKKIEPEPSEQKTILDKNQESNGTYEKKSEQLPTPARVRVPPGGFSSGLW